MAKPVKKEDLPPTPTFKTATKPFLRSRVGRGVKGTQAAAARVAQGDSGRRKHKL